MQRHLSRARQGRFPFLEPHNYAVTSDETSDYNCAGWAAQTIDPGLWWPEPDVEEYYWPPGARRDNTLKAFVEGFGMLGYVVCDNPELETGFEKIAVYAAREVSPKHVARQLPDGRWTSKLGDYEDIVHVNLRDVAGGTYGWPVLYLRRPFPPRDEESPGLVETGRTP